MLAFTDQLRDRPPNRSAAGYTECTTRAVSPEGKGCTAVSYCGKVLTVGACGLPPNSAIASLMSASSIVRGSSSSRLRRPYKYSRRTVAHRPGSDSVPRAIL